METNFFSYFAGYIDGDGHFRFRKYLQDGYECFNCKIMITSTRKEPLEYFKTNIGGSFYAKAKKSNNWKQEYIYTLHVGKKVFSKIKPIENFLIEKRTQFKLIEKFLNGTSDERKSICEIAIKERDSFLAQIDIFNTLKAENKTRTPKISDFSYLAGYIDAEGCLTVTRKTLKETNSLSFSCHIRVNFWLIILVAAFITIDPKSKKDRIAFNGKLPIKRLNPFCKTFFLFSLLRKVNAKNC